MVCTHGVCRDPRKHCSRSWLQTCRCNHRFSSDSQSLCISVTIDLLICICLFQVEFIEELLAADQLKAAVLCVRDLGLTDTYPDLEKKYRTEVVAELLARDRWSVAAKFVGQDADLQEQVCTGGRSTNWWQPCNHVVMTSAS